MATDKSDSFFVRKTTLTDGSHVFDVIVVDAYGDEHVFLNAVNESAAESCADALSLTSNNWR